MGHPADLAAAVRQAFGEIGDGALERLVGRLQTVDLPGGSVLFRQGELGDSLFIVLRGRLQVRVADPETGRQRLLGEVTAGEMVGEIGLLTGEARTATLSAVRDSRLLRIDRAGFDDLVEQDPLLFRQLARRVVERLRDRTVTPRFSRRLSNIALLPARAGQDIAAFADALCTALSRFGGAIHLNADNVATLAAAADYDHDRPASAAAARLDQWLAELEATRDFIVYRADPEPTAWSRRCLRQADVVLVVADAAADPEPAGVERSLAARRVGQESVRRILVLLQSRDGGRITGTADWLAVRDVDEHYHVVPTETGGLDRLARLLSGQAVGLVLGGGGARGFAHIGVYRALHEQGVPIDWVGGSSIGAVFAAAIAMGWPPDEIERQARRAFVTERALGDYTLPFVALLRGERLDREARRVFRGDVEDLAIPYFCVSCNLSRGLLVVHERGSLWRAVRASVALPGVLPPALDDGCLLVDGGILNNLPVDIMRDRPPGRVIAVDLAADRDQGPPWTRIPSPREILVSKLPFARRVEAPGMATLLMSSTLIASRLHASSVRGKADLVLGPEVGRFGLLQMAAFDDIVAVGYRHACEHLDQIKALCATD